MSTSLKAAMGIAGLVFATVASAQVTFYSREGFHGEKFSTDRTVRNFDRAGFNDRAASATVRGSDWQVCQDEQFGGRCAILRPGDYPSLAAMGLEDEISSARPVEGRYGSNDRNNDDRYNERDRRADVAQGYAAPRERLYEAQVTSVHAVVGPAEQRCWIERRDYSGDVNVPGAIAGAVIGGVLGNQIGAGHGREAATAGGAVAGAAIGANVGRDDEGYGRSVERCREVGRYDHPDYWDVTYNFRGRDYRIQMASPPGPTIEVDANGTPVT